MTAPFLDILVCTVGRRMGKIDHEQFPVCNGIRYVVACQTADDDDNADLRRMFDGRSDVEVFFNNTKGLSNNRNEAFNHVAAPYALIADDDIFYKPEGLEELCAALGRERPDIATVRIPTAEHHTYPPAGHPLEKPWRGYSPISFEIAVSTEFLRQTGVRFSPLMGIGAPVLEAGEENVFLHRLISHGARGRFHDIVIGRHPGPTTCTHAAARPGVIRARGAVMRICRGNFAALIRLPLEARRSPVLWPVALWHLSAGFVYSIRHRRDL